MPGLKARALPLSLLLIGTEEDGHDQGMMGRSEDKVCGGPAMLLGSDQNRKLSCILG